MLFGGNLATRRQDVPAGVTPGVHRTTLYCVCFTERWKGLMDSQGERIGGFVGEVVKEREG